MSQDAEPKIVTIELRVTDAEGCAAVVKLELDRPTLDEIHRGIRSAARALIRSGDADVPF